MNSIILKSLRIYCKDQTDWPRLIPAICVSYRASTTTSHGFSPFEVLFGKKMRTPIDTTTINDERTSPNTDTYLQHMIPKIELTRTIAKQNIQDCNKSTQFYYNRNSAYPKTQSVKKSCSSIQLTKKEHAETQKTLDRTIFHNRWRWWLYI